MKKYLLLVVLLSVICNSLYADETSVTGKKLADGIYTEGATDTTITGVPILWEAPANTLTTVSSTNPLPVSASQSGTWTMQPGNTANTTPWLVTPTPGTTGGWSASTQSSLSTVAQQVKGSAGTFGGYFFYNPNSAVAFLQVYDSATAAGATTITQKLTMGIPATSGANVELTNGINMANGIYVTASNTANTVTANTIPIAGSVIYK